MPAIPKFPEGMVMRFPEGTMAAIHEAADRDNIRISDVIRRAVWAYLKAGGADLPFPEIGQRVPGGAEARYPTLVVKTTSSVEDMIRDTIREALATNGAANPNRRAA
jgi:hypothetical protein